MKKLRVLDLFSGIGGFSLGLDRAGGFETVAFCEIEPFPRRVLAKHWPEVPCYEDVTKLTGDILERDGITGIDVITGGFPCQDISVAGKQAGLGQGTRSGLWSEIVRLIGELAPRYVIVETVSALLSGPSKQRGGWFGSILGDLAECGYDAEWYVIPSCYVGGWSERSRVWLFAYPAEKLRKRRALQPIFGQSSLSFELRGGVEKWPGRSALPSTRFCRKGDGVPDRMDRLAGIGNAVVPQIPELIGRAIMEAEGMI
jgi:DNA (cytosine-5)-methyltransferase 1